MELDFLGIALRWLHIMAAITLFGGLIFRAVALMPASEVLSKEDREKFGEAVRKRWAKVVGMAALVLIATGAWNLVLLIQAYAPIRGNADLGYTNEMLLRVPGWYKHAAATKIGLALIIFFMASLLVGRGKLARKLQAGGMKPVCITIVLAMTLVAISSTMRSTHTGPNVPAVMEVAVDKNPPPVFDPSKTQESSKTKVEEAPPGLDFAPPEIPVDVPQQ